MGSQRLPGKPLVDIHGKPMIQRVFEQTRLSKASRIVVATEDQAIFDCVTDFGGEVVMTGSQHRSGTDRAAEACDILGIPADTTIVNVQGDEPLIPPVCIDQVAEDLQQCSCDMATLCLPLTEQQRWLDANVVKVVRNQRQEALYFSRASIPFQRDTLASQSDVSITTERYRHVGIYAYSAGFLREFVGWGACHLEETEKLEQLRALYHGARIKACLAGVLIPPGIDTADDLLHVRQIFADKD
jgi:3-deoxy-manno-octulosonate cytidylyltransferase (CMP-KDO synthetase)